MKWKVFATGVYGILFGFMLFLNSCQDDPIVPNDPNGNNVDTTWVDSTGNGGSNPYDSTYNGGNGGTNPYDSTYTGGNGGNNPYDSTYTGGNGGTNPYDSTYWGGGNGNPYDSIP